ncbi:MAG: 4-alpha-glucanotransferase [Micrococcales bacterium]|nr:MAG: 4-alpha-glucanotransferase [Micrococcales bacterium]PIE27780.1 MAG: 4-alpha-glucanotransferase [Micrococcales bacterium]
MTESLLESTAEVGSIPELERLAHGHGVTCEYWDWHGNKVPLSVGTAVAVLGALGVSAETPDAVRAALTDLERAPWRQVLPPVSVVRAGRPGYVDVHVPHGSPVAVQVQLETGQTVPGVQVRHDVAPHEVDGVLVGEAQFELPADLPLGYHRLRAETTDGVADALLVVAPDRLELPAAVAGQVWGLQAQLYSVRSEDSWGLGDYADLGALAAYGAGQGADFVLVNPLHAPEPVPPVQNSPYLPTSRRYLSPLYIRVQDIPEYAGLAADQRATVTGFFRAVQGTNRSADLLDRQATWSAKLAALAIVFAAGRSPEREATLTEFLSREGEPLQRFALWCALYEHFDGQEWPDWATDADSFEAAQFAAQHRDRVDFYAWLQWVADEQLAAAQQSATEAGMRVGVITDLAVGVHPCGAEVWTVGDALAHGVTVGAPPDAFNQMGQNWSQPPWRPDRLAHVEYEPYRDMLRTVLRHAGGLRIDHVMGLFRLWCIPLDRSPVDGAYVRYDYEAMVSILLLEAHRAGAFVVGEDLGVVEPFVREYLGERGVLGTSIMWFEVQDGVPRPPEHYRHLCMATVGTHDLPPTAGYLSGKHVDLRHELGLLTESLEREHEFAAAERESFLRLLRDRGLLSADADVADTLVALHRYLALSPCALLGVSVTDLVGDARTQNQPGTDTEYPNWRMPLTDNDGQPVLVEDLAGHPWAQRLTAGMRHAVAGE